VAGQGQLLAALGEATDDASRLLVASVLQLLGSCGRTHSPADILQASPPVELGASGSIFSMRHQCRHLLAASLQLVGAYANRQSPGPVHVVDHEPRFADADGIRSSGDVVIIEGACIVHAGASERRRPTGPGSSDARHRKAGRHQRQGRNTCAADARPAGVHPPGGSGGP
jgi:hypothetical protein